MSVRKSNSRSVKKAARQPSVETSVNETLERLRSEGFRVTPQREDILRLLAESPERHSVQNIFQEIRKKHRSISLDTVYRTLATFANLGVVAQIKMHGADLAYEFQPPGHHHHHAICLDCGTSICMSECPLPASLFKDLEGQQFRVLSHSFEVFGYCSDCR